MANAMKKLGACVAAVLCAPLFNMGQWQVVLTDHLPQGALDLILDGGGNPAVIGHRTNANGTMNKSILWRLSPAGMLLDSLEIAHEGGFTYMRRLYMHEATNTILVTGIIADTFPDLGMAQRTVVAEVIGNTATTTVSGPVFRSAADALGFIDLDGSLVYGIAYWNGAWMDPFHFHTVRYCPGEGFCGGGEYTVIFPFDPPLSHMHVMARVPGLGIAGVSPTSLTNCWTSGSAINLFSDDLALESCLPILPIDSIFCGFSYDLSKYFDQYGLLPLASGNMVLCGMYYHSPNCNTSAMLAGVEKLGANGERLGMTSQFDSNSADLQRPLLSRPLSKIDDATFVFAFYDDAWELSPTPDPNVPLSQTSNVHVLRMDTALNILGEYIFDGVSMDRWHYPQSVVAAADGSVYVVGSVYDRLEPSPRPKAWIARIAPDQFVSVPDVRRVQFSLFPNPGPQGFQLVADRAIADAWLVMHDLLGRPVHAQPIANEHTVVSVPGLPSGLYLVSVTLADGSSWTTRWVKE